MRKIKLIFITVFLMQLFTSCDKTKKSEKADLFKNTIANNLGRNLSIPEDLKLYKPFPPYASDSTSIAASEFKLYTRINTSCSSCMEKISQWEDFARNIRDFNVVLILVCESKDNFEFLKYNCESGSIKNFPFPFFLDEKTKYTAENSFMAVSPHFETVLTDVNNKILLIGNPISSEKTYGIYINELQVLSKQRVKSTILPTSYIGTKAKKK